jgi:uncharacterized protein
MMIVVSDTSPLSNLYVIGQLQLLPLLYGRIIVPQAVMEELLELEVQGYDLSELKHADWLEVTSVPDNVDGTDLLHVLDRGEAEAIMLAHALSADWLLMDEAKGRAVAKENGLRVIGLLGVLLLAKQRGHVKNVTPILRMLVTEARFRVAQELMDRVIELAGERSV